ncbi:MAG: PEP-utilizing enzyme [Solirubrobacteraceae bacterium]
MPSDPVHQHSAADVYWTTVNATEAIPGTTTPLTWSFYSDPTELALRQTFATIGVLRAGDVALPENTDERFIGVFHAHPAANLTRFRLMADLAPGGSGDALERQFFGTVRTGVAPVTSKRRYPAVALRTPVAMALVSKRVRALRDEADRWWAEAVAVAPEERRDRDLVRDGADLYRRVLAWHGVGTMLTQGIYDQLGRVCAAAGLAGLELELVGGLDDLEEGAVVSDLWALSRGQLDTATLVRRHGFHGPDEGELSATVWRERPELLDATVAAFAAMAEDEHPDRTRERSRSHATAASASLMSALGPIARARTRPLIALVRRLMALREVGRAGLVRALDGTRCAARRLGDALVTSGALADREEVFFLTLEELTAGTPPVDAPALAAERRERHARYMQTKLPDGWWGDPVPIGLGDATPPATELCGSAASPGTIEGIARVVQTIDQRDELLPGEVLVCHTTDPGWASLMHLAAALVIDVGGPLSHGAIVARELGVPCVIGTQRATALISTGDRLIVDGSAGTVRILERSPILQ